jgi:hypothetical protein
MIFPHGTQAQPFFRLLRAVSLGVLMALVGN